MSLSSTTLATALKSLALYDNEVAAATAWATAWNTYFLEAEAGLAGNIDSDGLVNCIAAMTSALSGMSSPGQGASKIQQGIIAYWNAIIFAIAWPTCIGITVPPSLSSLSTTLQPVFNANTAPGITKDQAMDNIAGALHTANLGGTALFPVPPSGIGPQPIT